MRHGADWRNPARTAVRNVPFPEDLNHGKIQAGRLRREGEAGDPNAPRCTGVAGMDGSSSSTAWKLFLAVGVPRIGLFQVSVDGSHEFDGLTRSFCGFDYVLAGSGAR